MIGDSTVSSIGNGAIVGTIPTAPTNVVKDYSQISIDQVSFTWSTPSDDGGLPIIDYSVEKYYDETKNFVEIATGVTQTSYTLPGLQENSSYQLRVRARNSVGYGDYSSELSIATLMGTIGTIEKVYGDGDIKVNGIEMTSLQEG